MNNSADLLDTSRVPDGYTLSRSTPVFNETTVPTGLLKEHSTKAGTWGVLRVQSGTLAYHIEEPGYEGSWTLTPDNHGIIAPTHCHRIEVIGPVTFVVDFYTQPDSQLND